MAKGSRRPVRWRKDRERAKKAREKRKAEARAEARRAGGKA